MTELMELFKLLQPAQRLPEPHASARMNDAEYLRGCLTNHERYTDQSKRTKTGQPATISPLPELGPWSDATLSPPQLKDQP